MCTIFLSENPKGRDYSEDLGLDGRIILEWISTASRPALGPTQSPDQWVPGLFLWG